MKHLKNPLIHIGVWLGFITLETFISLKIGAKAPVSRFLWFYAIDVCLFYLNAYWGCPFSFSRKRLALIVPLVLFISMGFYFLLRNEANAHRRLEAERKALMHENSRLRAQINPHLLFNSLNFIYSHVVKLSPQATDAVDLLADLMTYAMEDGRKDGKIELFKEIEQMERYIRLSRLRFEGGLYYISMFPCPGK